MKTATEADGGRGVGDRPGLLLPDLGDDELAAALLGGEPAPEEHLTPSDGARRLTLDLGARHVEVIAKWAGRAMRGERADQLVARLSRLIEDALRLAREMDEGALVASYEELLAIVASFGVVTTAAARRRAARRLRDWTLGFAELVGGEAGARLKGLMLFRRGAFPLLEHLRQIRGIGPKRIGRLYAAGLTTASALGVADPEELAELVGLPRGLAERVVEASRAFAETERSEMVATLAEMTAEVARAVRQLREDAGPVGSALVDEVQRAIAVLERAVAEPPGGRGGG